MVSHIPAQDLNFRQFSRYHQRGVISEKHVSSFCKSLQSSQGNRFPAFPSFKSRPSVSGWLLPLIFSSYLSCQIPTLFKIKAFKFQDASHKWNICTHFQSASDACQCSSSWHSIAQNKIIRGGGGGAHQNTGKAFTYSVHLSLWKQCFQTSHLRAE